MNNARLFLTHLRNGDYAHAGDKEAIDIVIQKVLELAPEIQSSPCLDIGSGFGGTAAYLLALGFQEVYGIDIDGPAVNYAKKKYPGAQFCTADANHLSNIFKKDFFSFLYMFNVLYAIEDKQSLLEQLYTVAKPGAILALFDYKTERGSFSLTDLAGKRMYPLVLTDLSQSLVAAKWEIIEMVDLSPQFLAWYKLLLEKIENEEASVSSHFSKEDIEKVKTTFTTLYEWLKRSLLGGAVIYARKPHTCND